MRGGGVEVSGGKYIQKTFERAAVFKRYIYWLNALKTAYCKVNPAVDCHL